MQEPVIFRIFLPTVAEIYHPQQHERMVLYRILFHYFDQLPEEYESRFERKYGFLRPIIKKVVYRRRLMGELCKAAVEKGLKYFQAVSRTGLRSRVVAIIQSFGQKIIGDDLNNI